MTVTIDTQEVRALLARAHANRGQFDSGVSDIARLANLAEHAVDIIGLARDALRRAGCPVAGSDDLATLIDEYDEQVRRVVLNLARDAAENRRGGVAVVETTEEWGYAVYHHEGPPGYRPASDQEHAALCADGIATHVAWLNGPPRRASDVTGAAVVHRTRTRYADDYVLTSPWRKIRDGKPQED